MKTLLLILIFAFSIFSQKTVENLQTEIKPLRNNKRFTVEYDKFKDFTKVKFSNFSIYSSDKGGGIVYFGLAFRYDGDTLKTTADKFNLFFQSSGSTWRFQRNNNLIFLVDGERLPIGEGDADGKVNTTPRSPTVSEWINFFLTREQLEKIANGKETELQLGTFTGKLTDEHKQMLKDMLKLSQIK